MSDVVKLITTIGIVGASDHPAKATAERELQSVRDELFDLRQRVAELEADKSRLDWLEAQERRYAHGQHNDNGDSFLIWYPWMNTAWGDTFRQALDAAMAQQKEGKV